MTPWETILQHYQFPEKIGDNLFEPHPLQIQSINNLAPLANQGHWDGMGTGKTFIATACTLYHKIVYGHRTLVIVPPLLIRQWARWLRLISPKLSIVEYRGTPKERAALSLDADYVIVGVHIFKKEYQRFYQFYRDKAFTLIVDEASQMISSAESDSHRKVYNFHIGHPVLLLTGTPASNPMHGYSMMKFTAPGTYRNQNHFANTHVAEVDFFKNPSKFKNLELLRENLMKNADRILFEDMYKNTQPPLFIPLEYDLEPEHLKLYRKLSEDEILKMEQGKIDATAQHKLFHALGQIIVNWDHFASDPSKRSNALLLVEEKLAELDGGKLLVFCHYQMTAAALVRTFAPVCAGLINGTVTAKARERAKERFLDDPKARVLVLQAKSGGFGLDGLQHVCNTGFFIEPTQRPEVFHQAVARLYRTGQRNRVRIYMSIAARTLQPRAFRNLVKNDATANAVIRNVSDLRAAIYGE